MGASAAKKGDRVEADDIHVVLVPSGPALTEVPTPFPFTGVINGGLSTNVKIMGEWAAVAGATAENTPAHTPGSPTAKFKKEPSNTATVQGGSTSVMINGKPAIRSGDPATTCNDPMDLPIGKVVATGTVTIG
ncbi:PAAR domain-containing protein [Plantactinospora sp. WMMB334]|uniref:PAAR domain-containing protein n=1 Tax=Plantactinospora sp. WMMB334 TaxID=3404119 RepID=UPI003B932B1B